MLAVPGAIHHSFINLEMNNFVYIWGYTVSTLNGKINKPNIFRKVEFCVLILFIIFKINKFLTNKWNSDEYFWSPHRFAT